MTTGFQCKDCGYHYDGPIAALPAFKLLHREKCQASIKAYTPIGEIPAEALIPPPMSSIQRPVHDLLTATFSFMQRAGQLEKIGDFNELERHNWLKEEWNEYMKARSFGDEVEMIDGLLDIIVIAWGTLLQRYGDQWTTLFANEVARSNLDKVGPGMTVRPDGKVQKPADWRGPDIAGVLAAFRSVNVD